VEVEGAAVQDATATFRTVHPRAGGAGKPRVALGLKHDAPSLVVLDGDGALLSKVPGP
jgi:hypothetical protein